MESKMKKVKEYRSFLCSLSEVSRDKENHEILIHDEDADHRVVNFDGVKKNICKFYRGDGTCSCDAYLEKNNIRYLIEFKNQGEGNVDVTNIQNKAFDSLALLMMNEDLCRSQLAENTVLIIVYNTKRYIPDKDSYPASPSSDKFARKVKELAGKKGLASYPVKFGLQPYIGELYRNVYTVDVEVFKNEFYPVLFGNQPLF